MYVQVSQRKLNFFQMWSHPIKLPKNLIERRRRDSFTRVTIAPANRKQFLRTIRSHLAWLAATNLWFANPGLRWLAQMIIYSTETSPWTPNLTMIQWSVGARSTPEPWHNFTTTYVCMYICVYVYYVYMYIMYICIVCMYVCIVTYISCRSAQSRSSVLTLAIEKLSIKAYQNFLYSERPLVFTWTSWCSG